MTKTKEAKRQEKTIFFALFATRHLIRPQQLSLIYLLFLEIKLLSFYHYYYSPLLDLFIVFADFFFSQFILTRVIYIFFSVISCASHSFLLADICVSVFFLQCICNVSISFCRFVSYFFCVCLVSSFRFVRAFKFIFVNLCHVANST